MPFSLPRRASAAIAALATPLALTGLSIAAAPAAHADTVDPGSQLLAAPTFSVAPQPGDNCGNPTSAGNPPVPLSTGTVVGSGSASVQLNGSATDTESVAVSSTSTINVAQVAGRLSKITMTTTFSGQLSSAGNGTRCKLSGGSLGEALIGFSLSQLTYVTMTGVSHSGETIGVIQPGTDLSGSFFGGAGASDSSAVQLSGGKNATATSRLLLPPGQYTALIGGGGGPAAPGTASGTDVVQVAFDTPGTALTAAAGKGGKYVTLPDGASCSTSTATATWTKKAGKHKDSAIKKAVFKVGAQKVGAAKKTQKGDTTTLKGLPTGAPFTVTATIKLTSGKTVTVSRDYQACS